MFTVTLTFQYPAWDEKNGIVYEDIIARNKSEAVKEARRQARNDGHTGTGGKGLCWFTAVEQEG